MIDLHFGINLQVALDPVSRVNLIILCVKFYFPVSMDTNGRRSRAWFLKKYFIMRHFDSGTNLLTWKHNISTNYRSEKSHHR